MSSPDIATTPATHVSPLPAFSSPAVASACAAGVLIALTAVWVSASHRSADADTAPPPSFEQFTIMP
jgi:hypothetical protein